jgi:HPt (histidine-containing phosphotransfer) domain-containing protein
MPDARDTALDALLLAERAAYAGRAKGHVAEIESCLSEGRIEDARRAAHKLSGSAGTYGFPALSDAAREIDDALARSNLVDAKLLDRLRVVCEAVEHSVEAVQ